MKITYFIQNITYNILKKKTLQNDDDQLCFKHMK